MRRSDLGVAFFGAGAMARVIARCCVERGDSLVAVVDPQHAGRPAGDVLGVPAPPDLHVVAELAEVGGRPDAWVHATPHLSDTRAQLLALLATGDNVLSISGIVHPWRRDPALAGELDAAARASGASVLGTGLNPGFALDLLPLFVAGLATRVTGISALRVADLSPYGLGVARMYGLGCTPPEFEADLASGALRLHDELWQSLDLILDALGWEVEWMREEKAPVIALRAAAGAHVRVGAGEVRGFREVLRAGTGDRTLVELALVGLLAPGAALDDPVLQTTVVVEGSPGARVRVDGGVVAHPEETVAARVVNLLPWVVSAPPGLRRLVEVDVASPARAAGGQGPVRTSEG